MINFNKVGGGSTSGGLGSGGRIILNTPARGTPILIQAYGAISPNYKYVAGAGTIYNSVNNTLKVINRSTFSPTSSNYTGGTPIINGMFISSILVSNAAVCYLNQTLILTSFTNYF